MTTWMRPNGNPLVAVDESEQDLPDGAGQHPDRGAGEDRGKDRPDRIEIQREPHRVDEPTDNEVDGDRGGKQRKETGVHGTPQVGGVEGRNLGSDPPRG